MQFLPLFLGSLLSTQALASALPAADSACVPGTPNCAPPAKRAVEVDACIPGTPDCKSSTNTNTITERAAAAKGPVCPHDNLYRALKRYKAYSYCTAIIANPT